MTLPPPPPPGASGPEICELMQRYMAVMDDLSHEQRQALEAHLSTCPDCARTNRAMQRVTSMMSSLEATSPSAHVDEAVMAAIAARAKDGDPQRGHTPPRSPFLLKPRGSRPALAWLVAAAAVLLLLIFGALYASTNLLRPPAQAFSLPATLSWNRYVLYHSQTLMSSSGHAYQVMTYHNLADDAMHVETVMQGELDVVVVSDDQKTLGLDMMHHVAQWDADDWLGEEPDFNLDRLRADLQSGDAVYLGKSLFNGQEVYHIREPKGRVLLLNMQYQPVNVLAPSGKPVYDTLHMMPASQVSSSMWDMNMPKGFKMGQL
ncbi:MAG: zf-HC2 domain-containing protein, partial [Ktedonobacteraceae bacterium]|nr:zf-HC2 domain-containing protein [Ktedonobacteraceae bacterium]